MMSSFITAAGHPGYHLSSNSLALWNVNCILNQKDSRWLQLEVCREFQRNRCSRTDAECKFAHPTTNVEVQNGKVTACYDSIKGRCNREKPPCKYFHPPQHLKDQLLINGRNHLALKNAIMTQMGLVNQGPGSVAGSPSQQQQQQAPQTPLLPGQIQTVSSPYLTALPGLPAAAYAASAAPAPFLPGAPLNHQPTILHSTDLSPTSNAGNPSLNLFQQQQQQQQQLAAVVAQQQQQQANKPRSDRIEVCRDYTRGLCSHSDCRYAHPPEEVSLNEDGTVILCMDHEKRKCFRDSCKYFHRPNPGSSSSSCPPSPPPPAHAHLPPLAAGAHPHVNMALLAASNSSLTLPNLVPYKRVPSNDKSGQPIYHPSHHQSQAYQQALMHLQQPPFVPVTYTTPPAGIALPRYQ